MELKNVEFISRSLSDFTYGFMVGEITKETLLLINDNIQPYHNFNWLIDNSDKNDFHAIFELAKSFEFGAFFHFKDLSLKIISIPENISTAISLYNYSAKLGSGNANHQLGLMYEHGVGLEKNRKLAKSYFEQAALLGNAEALYMLGIYENFDNNIIKSYEYFLKAAQLGHNNAQFNVARAFYFGDAIWEKNLHQAFLFAKNAHDGNPNDVEIKKLMDDIYKELLNN
jgi:TPR repeat protein